MLCAQIALLYKVTTDMRMLKWMRGAVDKRIAIGLLSLSAAGLVDLVNEEGYMRTAYRDSVGIWTYGTGLTKRDDGTPVRKGDTITVQRSLQRTLSHVQNDEGIVKQCLTVPLAQREYDFIIKNCYNWGAERFCKSTIAERFNAGDYAGGCRAILLYKYVTLVKKDASGVARKVKFDCSTPGNRICLGLWDRRQKAYRQCMGEL